MCTHDDRLAFSVHANWFHPSNECARATLCMPRGWNWKPWACNAMVLVMIHVLMQHQCQLEAFAAILQFRQSRVGVSLQMQAAVHAHALNFDKPLQAQCRLQC